MAKKNTEPQFYISKINTQVMNYRVYVMRPKEKILYSALLFLVGGIIGLIFYGGLFKKDGETTILTLISDIVVFTLIGLFACKNFLLTNALSSGMNMTDSLVAVYSDLKNQFSDDSYIVQEVGEMINGVNNNIPIETMLEDFGVRSGISDITNFATVFSTCYRTGGNIKSIVRRTTEIISEKIMISSEIETAITSNKMQMKIMNVLPIVIVLMMRVLSSDFAKSFSSIVGVIGLTVSAGLTIAAYKLGNKIMDIKG